MKRIVIIGPALLALAALCWVVPPFHVVPLPTPRRQSDAAGSSPTASVRRFWSQKLVPAARSAPDLRDVIRTLATDPTAARKRFGRSPGFSSTTLFLVNGSGTVTRVTEDSVEVALDGAEPRVQLATSLVFGNTVRDATGLVDPSQYPNSQDFNDLSAALNRIVETEVLPALRQEASPGRLIRFAGCFELEEDARPDVLHIVPIDISWPAANQQERP